MHHFPLPDSQNEKPDSVPDSQEGNSSSEWLYIAESLRNNPGIERSRKYLHKTSESRVEDDVSSIIANVNNSIRSVDVTKDRASNRKVPAYIKNRFNWIASLSLVALVGITSLLLRSDSIDTTAEVREYTARRGQQAKFNLPDGSSVILNAGSRIRINSEFGGKRRDVYLEGEAQFTVTHSISSPFIVHANGTLVKDLATVFTVRGYPGDSKTTVYVAAGAVGVNTSNLQNSVDQVLEAGDLAVVRTGLNIQVHKNMSPVQYMGWVYGKLDFDDAPLGEVLMELSRWFDVDFIVSDQDIAQLRVSTRIRDDSKIDEVVQDICNTLALHSIIEGKDIKIVKPTTH